MKRFGSRGDMDMTNGAILPNVLLFCIPLMLSSILQLLFNAADVIVVGRFEGQHALAAVGSTGALTNLMVNVFLGLSVGANVVIARYCGAGAYKDASDAVHTAITISLLSGIALAVFGFFCAGLFLTWMGSPEEVLPLATVYLKVYFIGMPFNMLYNFGAAVLRSVGDTRHPLIYLSFAGIVNVVLNLFFVVILHIGVVGVALATIISQAISAVLVLICLMRSESIVHVEIRKLRVSVEKLVQIIKIGLPAGLQGVCFSLSNVLIQSTVNSFGATVVAGNSAASNIEGFIYVAMNAVHQASITFTSQNVGAHKHRRIRRVCFVTMTTVAAIGIVTCAIAYVLRYPLLSIYASEADVIAAGATRMGTICLTYYLCGMMDTMCGMLRGLGSTILPMVLSLTGACLFRILWIMFVIPKSHTLTTLYLSYPFSWFVTLIAHSICYFALLRKFPIAAEEKD